MNKVTNVKLNKINSVYDADTFRATINGIPDWLGNNVPFRIYGINSPEKGWRANCEYERNLSVEATEFIKNKIANGKKYTVNIHGLDKYGRFLVDSYIDDINIAKELLNNNMAKEYFGGTKTSWCNE